MRCSWWSPLLGLESLVLSLPTINVRRGGLASACVHGCINAYILGVQHMFMCKDTLVRMISHAYNEADIPVCAFFHLLLYVCNINSKTFILVDHKHSCTFYVAQLFLRRKTHVNWKRAAPSLHIVSAAFTFAQRTFLFVCVCGSVHVSVGADQSSPPAVPGSLDQAGLTWQGFNWRARGRQHEGRLSGGATGGDLWYRMEGKKEEGREKWEKRGHSVSRDSASQISRVMLICGNMFLQICFVLSDSTAKE